MCSFISHSRWCKSFKVSPSRRSESLGKQGLPPTLRVTLRGKSWRVPWLTLFVWLKVFEHWQQVTWPGVVNISPHWGHKRLDVEFHFFRRATDPVNSCPLSQSQGILELCFCRQPNTSTQCIQLWFTLFCLICLFLVLGGELGTVHTGNTHSSTDLCPYTQFCFERILLCGMGEVYMKVLICTGIQAHGSQRSILRLLAKNHSTLIF